MNIAQKYQIYKKAIEAMQGHTFYCEDGSGVLRRWTPPPVIDDKVPLVSQETPDLGHNEVCGTSANDKEGDNG